MTAVSLALTGTVLAGDNYSALAAQGYRWVTINGPYACNTEQGVERIVARHLIPTADTAIVPELPFDSSTARSRPNGNP